jgi:hypothetical protein
MRISGRQIPESPAKAMTPGPRRAGLTPTGTGGDFPQGNAWRFSRHEFADFKTTVVGNNPAAFGQFIQPLRRQAWRQQTVMAKASRRWPSSLEVSHTRLTLWDLQA